jgi:hypothetical protein
MICFDRSKSGVASAGGLFTLVWVLPPVKPCAEFTKVPSKPIDWLFAIRKAHSRPRLAFIRLVLERISDFRVMCSGA